ncbi:hypothetical protein GCM10022408_03330 [Hymenobacter fastidiosus]|uniref:STAS/SEC14 domain-containing protein n=1 Tax=Hymenobacter fastidiosus TaxID=486264 RepID=A0ABP7RDW3_9BACT
MSTATPVYLDLAYRNESTMLVGRWMRSVMPFELHRGYAAVLDLADERQCRYWLLDIRRRSSVDAADVHWMLEEFYPQLQPRLGGTTYLAFLMAPHQLAGVLANAAIPPLSITDGRPYRIERFTEEHSAVAWLGECQRQDSTPG